MKITDELLYRNMPAARDEWFHITMKENLEYEHDFSFGFKRKMHKLIRKNDTGYARRSFRPAIAWGLVLFLLLGGTTAYAYRDSLLTVMRKVKSDLTEYRFSSEIEGSSINSVTCEYIPEGYRLSDKYEMPISFYYHYVKEDDPTQDISVIVDAYSQYDTGTMIIDTEDALVQDISIGSLPAEYIEKGSNVQILWNDGNVVIWITARNLEKGEFIRIAEGIKVDILNE